jgi:hypothetical protein
VPTAPNAAVRIDAYRDGACGRFHDVRRSSIGNNLKVTATYKLTFWPYSGSHDDFAGPLTSEQCRTAVVKSAIVYGSPSMRTRRMS